MKKLCMLLIFIMFITSFGIVNAQSLNMEEQSFELKLNLDDSLIKSNVSKNTVIGTNNINTGDLKIKLEKGKERSKVKGTLHINDMEYKIIAEGTLQQYDALKENDYSKGVFTGYIYKDGNIVDEVVFDLQYDTFEKKYSTSSMTIGVVEEDTKTIPISLYFGKMDSKLNEAFYKKNELKNKKDVSLNSGITTMSEVPDYTLREYDDFNSDFGDIMYIAGYHPSTIGDHESASMYIKTWTNKDNIRDYFEDYYDSYIIEDSVAVYKTKLEIINEDYWEADDPTPEDGDNSFDMLLPIYLGQNLSFQLISVPIKTNYTDFTASGSPNENEASWILEKYFGYFETTDAQSSRPWYDDDEYGMGATCTFSYRSNVSSSVEKDIEFSGTYYCSATDYNGGLYKTQYLSFKHDIESTIEVTP